MDAGHAWSQDGQGSGCLGLGSGGGGGWRPDMHAPARMHGPTYTPWIEPPRLVCDVLSHGAQQAVTQPTERHSLRTGKCCASNSKTQQQQRALASPAACCGRRRRSRCCRRQHLTDRPPCCPCPCSLLQAAAAMASTEELVELLIDGARYGDADDVHKALEGKVDVNAADEWGKTGGQG